MHSSQTGPWSQFLICAAATVLLAAPGFGQDPPLRVALETSHGTIVLELNAERAPITVENFLQYVRAGWYDGTIFHRVIDGFMIQGGGYDSRQQLKITRQPIENEAGNGLLNERGTIAMARKGDPDSATAQFYINLADNDFLNREEADDGVGYAVFGRVVEGMETVDSIAKVKVRSGGLSEAVPVETVLIRKVSVQQ